MQQTAKRQRFTAEQAKAHVQAQHQSGLSIVQYCRVNDIRPTLFYNWRVKHKGLPGGLIKSSRKSTKAWTNDCNWLAVPNPKSMIHQVNTVDEQDGLTQPERSNPQSLIKLTLPGGIELEIRAN